MPRVAEVVNRSLKADCTDFSLVYTDSKKTSSCLLPRHAIFATFGRQIKMPTCTHTGRFISVPLCSGQSELACVCLFVQFNNQLDV